MKKLSAFILIIPLLLSSCNSSTSGITNSVSTGKDSTESNQQQTIPEYKLSLWDLKKMDSENSPGWSDYTVSMGFSSNIDQPLMLNFCDSKGQIITQDGNSYDAFLESRQRTDQVDGFHLITGLNDFINNSVLPPGVIVTGFGSSGITHTGEFRISFRIPSTLAPKTLTINNFAAVDLTNLPNNGPKIGDPISSVTGINELPIEIPDYEGVNISISNPRIIKSDDSTVLAIDVDLVNNISTDNSKTYLDFSVIDSNGIYYVNGSTFCGDKQRDFVLDDNFDITIGPLQTLKGIFCVILLDTPSDKVLNNGEYILAGYTEPTGVIWFKINAPQ